MITMQFINRNKKGVALFSALLIMSFLSFLLVTGGKSLEQFNPQDEKSVTIKNTRSDQEFGLVSVTLAKEEKENVQIKLYNGQDELVEPDYMGFLQPTDSKEEIVEYRYGYDSVKGDMTVVIKNLKDQTISPNIGISSFSGETVTYYYQSGKRVGFGVLENAIMVITNLVFLILFLVLIRFVINIIREAIQKQISLFIAGSFLTLSVLLGFLLYVIYSVVMIAIAYPM